MRGINFSKAIESKLGLLLVVALSLLVSTQAVVAEENPSTERSMRRTDYLLTDEEALCVVKLTKTAVLGTVDKSGTPYVVPVSPVYINGKIYFHGTNNLESRKLNNIRQNPKVSMVWVGADPTKEEEYTVKYISAIVAGTAREIHDPATKSKVFSKFLERFTPSRPLDEREKVTRESINDAVVWEVTIDKLSGKAKQKIPFLNHCPRTRETNIN